MKRFALIFSLLGATLAAAPKPLAPPASNEEVSARQKAFTLTDAWANDGFKARDAHFVGTFEPGKPKFIRVNLYAGNQYWFSLAADKAKKVAVQVYDETGKPVTIERFEEGDRAAAGFAPQTSGPYLVQVELVEGESSAFALLYSYR